MPAPRLPRRLVVGGASAALLAGAVGFLPLLTSASAAPSCASWTDPAGDSIAHDPVMGEADPTGTFAYPNLDIVASTFGTVGDSVVATIKTDGLSEDSSDAGDEFGMSFTVAGVDLFLYADRARFMGTPYPPGPTGPFEDAGVSDGSTFSSDGTATYDVATKTVTISVKTTSVAATAGKAVVGQVASGLSAYTSDQFLLEPVIGYDDSATTQTATLGVACTGGATPEPTGSGSPSATPSATPTPSGSPSATPTPTPTATTPAAGGLFDQPRKGCVQYKDEAGDADPTPTGQDNEDSLDVTQVNLKSPADGSLQVFVKLADVSAGLNLPGEGGAYDVTTNVAGKAVVVSVDDTGAVTDATVGGTASPDLKPTAKLDEKNSNLVVTLPKDGLEKALKTTLATGTAVTGTLVETTVTTPGPGIPADDAAGTTAAEKTYAYGDNTCFLPPPGVLTIDADAAGQYSDATELFATLTDVDEAPVQGATVTARLGGGKVVSATTDEDGIADLFLPVSLKAGATTITATFAGNSEVGAVKAVTPFKVLAEKTVLKAVGIRGGAKATVLDDDRHPVVGRPVVFTVGSRKTVVKTNAQGVAVLGRLARGTAVKVGFPAVPGYYLATPTYTVKAL
jgi:hypothetical protein